MTATLPRVSVIVPCYNEEDTITLLLDALYRQTYPQERMEVVIADGLSTDGTRAAIAAWQRQHPDLSVRVVDNPKRIIPAALNVALRAAQGEIIVRLDAHSVPAENYVARCVADLQAGLGDNVGGVWRIRPGGQGLMAEAIALAAAHPLGVGDARYRHANPQPGPVDTVPFGAYRRDLIERIGFYDETLLSNEDYEFNTRVRLHGGTVYLDPQIQAVYFARPTLGALARQYARYGYWKAQMLRRYPHTLRWRQALPPLFVLALALLPLLGLVWPLAWLLWVAQVIVYALALLAVGLREAWRRRQVGLAWALPAAMATMHLTWGAAFLWGWLAPPKFHQEQTS